MSNLLTNKERSILFEKTPCCQCNWKCIDGVCFAGKMECYKCGMEFWSSEFIYQEIINDSYMFVQKVGNYTVQWVARNGYSYIRRKNRRPFEENIEIKKWLPFDITEEKIESLLMLM